MAEPPIPRPVEQREPVEDVEALWERLSGVLARYSAKLLGNTTAGEDTVQDVFRRYLESGPIFESRIQQDAWLWRTTRNAVIDGLRSRKRQKTESLDAIMDMENKTESGGWEPADASANPERHADLRQRLARIQQAFETLSDSDRDLLWLVEVEGFTLERLARIVRRPSALVKVRLHRARKRLKAAAIRMGAEGT